MNEDYKGIKVREISEKCFLCCAPLRCRHIALLIKRLMAVG